MLTRRNAILLLATAITLIGIASALCSFQAFVGTELKARDLVARNGRLTQANPKLIFLAIDNASIGIDASSDLRDLFGISDAHSPEGHALRLMSKGWPWPRSIYSHVMDRLVGAGARVVAFDLTFPTASASPAEDADFQDSLKLHAEHVVIGSNFIDSARPDGSGLDVSLTPPAPTIIPQNGHGRDIIGFVNFWPDFDGIVRHAQFRTTLAEILGNPFDASEGSHLSLAARAVEKAGGSARIPIERHSHAFRYTAPPGFGFAPRSLFEIFVPDYWAQNYQSGEAFKDAIVIVGAAGNWQHDEHQSPFGLMSGPELQLNVMNALLHGEFVREATWQSWYAAWLAAGVIAFAICIPRISPLIRLGVLVVAVLSWLGLGLVSFNKFNFYIPLVGPLGVLFLTWLLTLVADLVIAGAEQIKLNRNISERKRIQEALELTKDELEKRVQERTAELTETNAKLAGLLNEKELLLKEVHHRVKNNLQVISSLLNLQSEYIKDPEALQVFAESRNRVRSMALIHEKLYQSHDLARIDFADYLRSLTRSLQSSFGRSSSGVQIAVDVDEVMLGVDAAVPCGLIVNELVTNCIKYAFPGNRAGEIRVSMERVEGPGLRLSVADNGVGFPKDVDFRNTNSLGMQIITTLAEQLDGTIHMSNGVGTRFDISFPEQP